MHRNNFVWTASVAAVMATTAVGHDETAITGILESTAPSIVTVKVVIETEVSMMGQGHRAQMLEASQICRNG